MKLRRVLDDYLALVIILAALVAFFSLTTPRFSTPETFRVIASQAPDAIVIAVGMTLVMISGGIDLSVGSVLALSGATIGVALTRWQMPLLVGWLAGLLVGGVCGALNGLLTVRWSLPSFIVTLAMLEAARGATYLLTESRTLYLGRKVEGLTEMSVGGVSLPFLLALAVVVTAQLLLSRTGRGRGLIAVGANEEAARLSGLETGRIRTMAFTISGLLAALGAAMQTARLASADPNMGSGMELAAIAAAVIGGTSLSGGRGSVVASLLGVLIISVLGTGLAHFGAGEPTKRLVTGLVIVAAAGLDALRRR